MKKKMLPVGIEFFDELIRQNFYYVDKTKMIADLLRNWGKVNLFTRPRRFGKSLNMSMLKNFFEIGNDRTLFEGLEVWKEQELCEKYMGQFPVISISLKGTEGMTFDAAKKSLKDLIGTEARRFGFLAGSDKLTHEEKISYKALISVEEDGSFSMSDTALERSLLRLTELLQRHYEKQVILLIDEYDVPLDKAFQNGYYDEMAVLIRSIFGNVLKTNQSLYFAVLTGCLRISKESIFTGLNNLKVMTVTDVRFDEYFGFTDAEVRELLEYYECTDHYTLVKEWYDGYRFGNVEVYCPWDVLNYCDHLLADRSAAPEDYWSNTSSNSIVRRFIEKGNGRTRDEIERLIAGQEVIKEVKQDLTYNELDQSIENMWSVLFTTGYLTQHGKVGEDQYRLAIPNREIRKLFVMQIRAWFKADMFKNPSKLERFCNAFQEGKHSEIEEILNDYLWKMISIRDTAVSENRKENFYHGILLGLLSYKEDWVIKSNEESGLGYSDILVEIRENRTGIVIEMKYAKDGNLEAACKEALIQIEKKKYETRLREDGMQKIIKYGIACFKKDCKVIMR